MSNLDKLDQILKGIVEYHSPGWVYSRDIAELMLADENHKMLLNQMGASTSYTAARLISKRLSVLKKAGFVVSDNLGTYHVWRLRGGRRAKPSRQQQIGANDLFVCAQQMGIKELSPREKRRLPKTFSLVMGDYNITHIGLYIETKDQRIHLPHAAWRIVVTHEIDSNITDEVFIHGPCALFYLEPIEGDLDHATLMRMVIPSGYSIVYGL